MVFKFLIFITCIIAPFLITAQDANYWSSNYGPGGFFTPGAVVAYNRDSGVFFYNPALLGLSEKSSTSLSANIYELSKVKVKNGVGTGKDLTSSLTNIVPLMVSGSILLKGIKSFKLGYSLINLPVTNVATTQRLDSKTDVLDESYSPGSEIFIGQYTLANAISQTSGIISLGTKISKKFAAGISAEGLFRRQTYEVNYKARALVNIATDTLLPPISSTLVNYQSTYYAGGIRFKAGIAYDNERHHFGLTVSSPILHIVGKGTLVSDVVLSNIKDVPSGITINLLANARQEGLKSSFKMPVSIAGGYAFDLANGGQLYIAAEYFSRVKEYNILTPRNEYFIRPDTGFANKGTASQLKLKDAGRALTNFAAGVSFPVKQNVMAYLSLRTDFNYSDFKNRDDEEGYIPNISIADIYHAQLGLNVKKRKFNLRTGFMLGYGSTKNLLQNVNFDNPDESNFLLGIPVKTKYTFFTLGLMFSYIYNL